MKIEQRCIALLGLLGSLLLAPVQAQAQAQAQTTPTAQEKEEVRVEWDFSRRSPIHPHPFARAGVSESEGLQGLANKDLQDNDQQDKDWTVPFSDGTVRRMLQRWADDAGYQLLWEVSRDYPIEVEMKLHGPFRDAVSTVVKSLALTDAPVQASINPDIRLVRVVRYLNGQAR